MIFFRCDAGPQIGIGHLSRCRALAYEFSQKGIDCGMVGPKKDFSEDDRAIFKVWKEALPAQLNKKDSIEFIEIMSSYNSIAAVVDLPILEERYQLDLFNSKIKWLQFQSNYDLPIWADWLLYANPSAKPEYFLNSLRRKGTKLFVGAKYAVLKKEFSDLPILINKKTIKNVLMVFGGGDDHGMIRYTLEELMSSFGNKLKYTVVSGKRNPNNADIEKFISSQLLDINFIVDPPLMSKIMLSSDIAITSGGTQTYELAACNVPMIIVALSKDQEASKFWTDSNCGVYLGRYNELMKDQISSTVDLLSRDFEMVEKIRKSQSSLVDGKGALRVSCGMLSDMGMV